MKFIRVLASIVGFVGLGMQAPAAQAQVAVGDFVYEDENRNGVFDLTEVGLSGVLITLFSNEDGDGIPQETINMTRTMVSGEGGGYFFDDLPAGPYCVQVTPPADYTLTVGTGSTASPYCFDTLDGDVLKDLDFGFGPPIMESPFACDGRIFQLATFRDSSGEYTGFPGLYELTPRDGVYNYDLLFEAPFEGYGFAFNAADGHVYAVTQTFAGNTSGISEFVRAGTDGVWTSVGTPVSAVDLTTPWTTERPNNGTMDGDGNFYFWDITGSTSRLIKVDLNPVEIGDLPTYEVLRDYGDIGRPFSDFSFDPVVRCQSIWASKEALIKGVSGSSV